MVDNSSEYKTQSTRSTQRMILNEVSGAIVDSAIEVHNALGPGRFENVYQECLRFELQERGFKVFREVGLPVRYKFASIDLGYRIDLLVEDRIIIELKAIHAIAPIHKVQLFTYLKLSGKELGLLLNFNVKLMKQGITRIINSPSACSECSAFIS